MSNRAMPGDDTTNVYCTECETLVRLLAFTDSGGTALGCDCRTTDSVPKNYSNSHLPREWALVRGPGHDRDADP